MDFGPLGTFTIEKPPRRLDLWPDPVATYNLGGDYWTTVRDMTLTIQYGTLEFAPRIAKGFLVDVAKMPSMMRWFIKPHSLAGRVLLAYQWLKENQLVYDTSGQVHRLTRRRINNVVKCLLREVGIPRWPRLLISLQLSLGTKGRYYAPDHNPNKLILEVHTQEKALLKEAQKNDRAKGHP